MVANFTQVKRAINSAEAALLFLKAFDQYWNSNCMKMNHWCPVKIGKIYSMLGIMQPLRGCRISGLENITYNNKS
ncbi:MAG: hypothetical protein MI922_04930, partial [Bacteroidales bacterium]|nr:hypothetical protein [Bacteroidales bacterium]